MKIIPMLERTLVNNMMMSISGKPRVGMGDAIKAKYFPNLLPAH